MKLRNIIGWFFITGLLLFSNLMHGKPVTAPSDSTAPFDQGRLYQLNSPGLATESYTISLPTLTVPIPVYHFLTLTFTYHPDTYEKRLFFLKEYSFISPFLRNIFYVFTSIHAP